jgi:hypothetical protein
MGKAGVPALGVFRQTSSLWFHMKKLAPWLIGLCFIGWAGVKMLPPKPTAGFEHR